MEKISFIYPSDLGGLKTDENGNYLVPEGFEIYRLPSKEDRIAELQKEIDNINQMSEPSNDELIEIGKMMHPYYMEQQRKIMLIGEMEGLL